MKNNDRNSWFTLVELIITITITVLFAWVFSVLVSDTPIMSDLRSSRINVLNELYLVQSDLNAVFLKDEVKFSTGDIISANNFDNVILSYSWGTVLIWVIDADTENVLSWTLSGTWFLWIYETGGVITSASWIVFHEYNNDINITNFNIALESENTLLRMKMEYNNDITWVPDKEYFTWTTTYVIRLEK